MFSKWGIYYGKSTICCRLQKTISPSSRGVRGWDYVRFKALDLNFIRNQKFVKNIFSEKSCSRLSVDKFGQNCQMMDPGNPSFGNFDHTQSAYTLKTVFPTTQSCCWTRKLYALVTVTNTNWCWIQLGSSESSGLNSSGFPMPHQMKPRKQRGSRWEITLFHPLVVL